MANTLTSLIPDFSEAMDVISREMVGFVPAVSRDSRLDRVALNQNVIIPVTRTPGASATNTPGVNAPDTGDDTIDNVSVTNVQPSFGTFRQQMRSLTLLRS